MCRNGNLVVVVVRATETATIEAYFWSTTHTETDPVVDSGGERERDAHKLSEEKTKKNKNMQRRRRRRRRRNSNSNSRERTSKLNATLYLTSQR